MTKVRDRVLVFDVNETLLDLRALDPVFERAFGSAALREQWFAQMLQLAFVGGLTGRYVDFSSAQRAALEMLAERRGVELDAAVADEVAATMRSLPPHDDVPDALDRLRGTGLALATLTNSSLEVVHAQLDNAGLSDRFDAVLSADEVRALKPRSEPYELVARTFGVRLRDVRLVAAHAWDIAGATAAGCAAAFVARPGKVLSPLTALPPIVASDLREVADGIAALDG
jgi:2-haloacid dehalogenase